MQCILDFKKSVFEIVISRPLEGKPSPFFTSLKLKSLKMCTKTQTLSHI